MAIGSANAEEVKTLVIPASSKAPNEIENLKAHAEKVKAEAEMVKAQAEAKKVEVEATKAEHANWQFYFDWAYKIILLVGVLSLLLWLFPQIQEFSFPWGSGIATVKRAPKEGPSTPPNTPHMALLAVEEIENIKKGLMEAPGVPPPAAQGIIDNLEELEEYKTVGIERDSIYVCHRARKIPKSEHYQVQIYLDANENTILEKIDRVTYVLHPTFPERERTLTQDPFQLEIRAWGEFMLYALVYFKGRGKPIQLKRYLNF
ncbi:MAG: hypothetical protein QM706_02475 [Nitrospira sp.]